MGLLDVLKPVGDLAGAAASDVGDAFSALGSAVHPAADAFSQGLSEQGNTATNVPDALGNLGHTLLQGGTVTPDGSQDRGLMYGLGHDLGAIGNAGDQIGHGFERNTVAGFANMPNNLTMGAVGPRFTAEDKTPLDRLPNEPHAAPTVPLFSGVLSLLGNPTSYTGTGLAGDALKGGALALKSLPALAEAPALDGLAAAGDMWKLFSKAGAGNVEDMVTAPLKALGKGINATPVLGDITSAVFGKSPNAWVNSARDWMKGLVDPVFDGSSDVNASNILTRLSSADDLTKDEMSLKTALATVGDHTEQQTGERAFSPEFVQGLADKPPAEAASALVDEAERAERSSKGVSEGVMNNFVRSELQRKTLGAMQFLGDPSKRPAFMDAIAGLQAKIGRATLAFGFYPLHILGEDSMMSAMFGGGLGSTAADDYTKLVGHLQLPEIVERGGQMQQVELGAAPVKTSVKKPGIWNNLLEYAKNPTKWATIGQEIGAGVQRNFLRNVTTDGARAALEPVAAQFPEVRAYLDEALHAPPGLASDGMHSHDLTTDTGILHGANPDRLSAAAQEVDDNKLLSESFSSILQKNHERPPGLGAQAMQYPAYAGQIDRQKWEDSMRQHVEDYINEIHMAHPQVLGDTIDQFLKDVTNTPYVQAAPMEAYQRMQELSQSVSRAPHDILSSITRQAKPGMDPADRQFIFDMGDKLIQQHVEQVVPKMQQLLDTVKTQMPGEQSILGHMLGTQSQMLDLAGNTWTHDREAVAKLFASTPVKDNTFWSQTYPRLRQDIWNRYNADMRVLEKKSLETPETAASQVMTYGSQYTQAQLAASRKAALSAFEQNGKGQVLAESQFAQSQRDSFEKLMGKLNQSIEQHRQFPYAQLQADHYNRLAGLSSQFSPEAKQAYQDALGTAADNATKLHGRAFVNYGNESNFDNVMKSWFSPFWQYQSAKFPRMARLYAHAPGLAKAQYNYYHATDNGYTRIGDSPFEVNPMRASFLRTASNYNNVAGNLEQWSQTGNYPTTLPSTSLTGPFGSLDMFNKWATAIGFAPGVIPELMSNVVGPMSQHQKAEAMGLVPSVAELPGQISAVASSQKWLPPVVRQAIGFGGWDLLKDVQSVMGDKFYDYNVNQELASKGVDPDKATEEQKDEAERTVTSWRLLAEQSSIGKFRPDMDSMQQDVAGTLTQQYGMDPNVVKKYALNWNPTSAIFAKDDNGKFILNSSQRNQIMDAHPTWKVFGNVNVPLSAANVQQNDARWQEYNAQKQGFDVALEKQYKPVVDATLAGGPVTGPQLRDVRSKVMNARAVLNADLASRYSDLLNQPSSQQAQNDMDTAAAKYWSADAPQDPMTGEPDFDKLDMTRKSLLGKMDAATQNYVLNQYRGDKFQDPNLNAVERSYQSAQKILQPYFDLSQKVFEDTIGKQLPPQLRNTINTPAAFKSVMASIEQSHGMKPGTLAQQSDAWQNYSSKLSQMQNVYRHIVPEADLALSTWYGRTPVHEGLQSLVNRYGVRAFLNPNTVQTISDAGAKQRALIQSYSAQQK